MTRHRHLVALAAAAALASAVITGCSSGSGDATTTTTRPAGSQPTTTTIGDSTSTTGADGADLANVRVYFAQNEAVATAGRSVPTPAVARGAMEALLEGPDAYEADIGMGSEIPDGTELLDLALAGGEARVDLSGQFASGGGSLSMQLRVAEVVFTLTQFDTIDEVTILLDGEEATEGIGGEGVPASGVDRGDFENVTPAILVESPVPGEEVGSPLEVTGIANTFEANVRYDVTDPEGEIIDDGFTTASAGNGVWGDFSFTSEFRTHRQGFGAVIVFQDDAATGAQRDVYEVPVRMG